MAPTSISSSCTIRAGDVQRTAGPTVVENSVFFLRLVQRLVHLLTVHSAAGRLYEVDTRLRPSGKGGLLVQSIDAFRDYQRREAWTWEHQALLRARAGRRAARAARALRGSCASRCCATRVRRDRLREDVRSMRERMRAELVDGEGGRVRPQAGSRRYHRHRVPGAVLGAALGRTPCGARDVSRTSSVSSRASPRSDLVPQATVDVLTGAYRDVPAAHPSPLARPRPERRRRPASSLRSEPR